MQHMVFPFLGTAEVWEDNMGWSAWRLLAQADDWYPDAIDWDGPACYELALGGPRGGDLETMYIGEGINVSVEAYVTSLSRQSRAEPDTEFDTCPRRAAR